MMQRKAWVMIIASLLVLLFIYTGVNKLADFLEFSSQIRNQPLPQWMNKIATWLLPALELLIAALLMTGKFRELGFLLAFFMMAAFTIYVLLIITNTFSYIPCSCGGIFKWMNWNIHLVVNIIFTVLAYIGYRQQRKLIF
jgi:putative oxidoreductase